MYPHVFYAKSSLEHQQIEVKEKIGCDGLEYQLMLSDFAPGKTWFKKREECFELMRKHPAAVIHPPLDWCNIDNLLITSARYCGVMEESMRLAQISAETSGQRTLAIIHVNRPPEEHSPYLTEMDKEIERLLSLFPSVDVVLENITPFRNIQAGSPEFCNGFYDANVKFAQRWAAFGDNGEGGWRVMTCLDICHALLSGFYLDEIKRIYEQGESSFPYEYSLEHYISMNSGVLGLIHLASAEGSGYGLGHGAPFALGPTGDELSGRNMNVLDEFFQLYDKYELCCPATIEVREDDFLVSDNYASSIEAIRWMEEHSR